MKFKDKFLYNYLKRVPLALGIERSLECEILSKQEFERPILDIGCGEGLFAFILFNEKLDVGIDPNAEELKTAEKYGMYKELVHCSGDNIPGNDGSFRTILSNSVLEHIPDLEPVLEEAHRLLHQEGRFYVTVPTDLFDHYNLLYQLSSGLGFKKLAERIRIFFNRFWNHYNFHNRANWEKIFNKAGFEIEDHVEYDPKPICLMNDLLVPFAFPAFIVKKAFNIWVLLPFIRGILVIPSYLVIKMLIKKLKKRRDGGIIFFALKKIKTGA